MKYKIAGVSMMLIVAAATLGASAYTSASVERTSNVNVVNDDTGLLALEDGTSGDLVFQNSSGALEIDFTQGGAGGVNTNATYTLGNTSSSTTQTAFNLTNLDAESHDITLSYTGSDAEDTDENLQFRVYNSTGSKITTVSEESDAMTLNGVASGETHYVVIVVDTHGVSNETDLSGTLEVSV
jgi:hypothetical protein